MQLSKNFTLSELTITETGLLNEPDALDKAKLLYLANFILQPVRDRFGPLKVSSGFRSLEVNTKIGGSKSSQHMSGEAADFIPLGSNGIDGVFEWIVKESNMPFGQCIRESKDGKNWIHISLPRVDNPNRVSLVYDGKDYKPYAG